MFNSVIIIIIMLGLSGFAMVISVYNYENTMEELINKANNTAKLASISLFAPIWNLDEDGLHDIMRSILLDKDVVAIRIFDTDGKTLITKQRGTNVSLTFEEMKNREDMLFKTEIIRKTDNIAGEVQIVTSNAKVVQLIRRTSTLVVLFAIILIAVMTFFVWLIGRYMVQKPIKVLQENAAALAAGNLDIHIDTRRRDELGSLAGSFDNMRTSIRTKINDLNILKERLELLNQDLGNLVAARTQKLSQAYSLQQSISTILQRSLDVFSFEEQLNYALTTMLSKKSFGSLSAGCIFIVDPANVELLDMQVHIGMEDDVAAKYKNLPFESCLCGQAAIQREIIYADCLNQQDETAAPITTGHYCIPILSNNTVLGVININLQQNYVRNQDDDRYAMAIANTLAGVIERKRTQDELHVHQNMLEESIAQLQEARDQAVTANATKSLFLANMSHEIRTPLTAIMGFSEILLEENQSAIDHKNAVETILRNGDHLLNLINEILDLSKIEAQKFQIERLPMCPFQLITDTTAMLSTVTKTTNIVFTTSFKFPLPKQIICDPTRLRQIVINLCSNALKFTQKGQVQLITSFNSLQKLMKFSVVDTGIGLSKEQQEQVFGAFSQAEVSTTRKYGGTGLGLHISKRLAQMLGGDISVTSQIGKGSQFDITVSAGEITDNTMIHDLSEVSTLTQTTISTKNIVPKLRGNILLAEDGHDNQRVISLLLQRAGLTVDLAENGKIAVDKASAKNYDLILMDMQMPVMGGEDATKTLLQAHYHGPIVALTGSVLKEEQARFRATGCTDVLAKPINKDHFYQVLETYCESEQPQTRSETLGDNTNSVKLQGHILVVEDSKENQRLLAILLRKLGLSTDIAENGKEAVAMAVANHYDLVLMDIQMPIMDGVESTSILRKNGFKQPIIACTANLMKTEQANYFKIGCNDLIPKPIDRQHFNTVLNKYLKPYNEANNEANSVPVRPSNCPSASLSAKFLVVESAPNITVILKDILHITQSSVDHVNNSDSFIERALGENFNLILLDIHMQDAEEALSVLKQCSCKPFIIAYDLTPENNNKEKSCPSECAKLVANLDKNTLTDLLSENLSGWYTTNTDDKYNTDNANDDGFAELCQDFLNGLPDKITKITDATTANDWKTVAKLLHALKGSGGTFGQPYITKIAAKAEELLNQKDYPKVNQTVQTLTEHCSKLL